MIRKIFTAMILTAIIIFSPNASAAPHITFQAHVQDVGWKPPVGNGAIAGSIGEGRRLEALIINCEGVEYQAHIQDIGWQRWRYSGEVAGTVGESLRMEAIKIRLRGHLAQRYDIRYRAYVHKHGWSDWVENGEVAGTTGRDLRIEAVQIELVERDRGYSRDRYDDDRYYGRRDRYDDRRDRYDDYRR